MPHTALTKEGRLVLKDRVAQLAAAIGEYAPPSPFWNSVHYVMNEATELLSAHEKKSRKRKKK